MKKRKRSSEDEYEEISKKIKRLERKLLRARKRESPSTSSESVNSLQQASKTPSEHEDGQVNNEEQEAAKMNDYYDEVLGTDKGPINPPAQLPPAVDHSQPSEITDQLDQQPPVMHLENASAPLVDTNETLSGDILEVLGEDPSASSVYGKEIHKELTNRLHHILVNGLTKETRKEVTEKYLVPENCKMIAAPELNLEIKAALPEMCLKRDRAIETRQKQLASAISCLSEVISLQLLAKDKDNSLLKRLMDATRILCDLQHGDSIKRRYFATSSLKKDITDHLILIPTKIDKYLFGENLSETLKAAKAVSKSGAELKFEYNKQFKKTNQPTASTSRGSLNWRARGAARRQPVQQNNRQPASARMRPETSSRPYQRHPPTSKYNRRH